MRYLALDLGSSWTKTALLEDGNVLQERSVPTPMPKDTTGLRFEIDAEAYFRQVQTELEYYLPQKPGALLLSTQMHGCVLTDAAFQPLTPYISWRDGMGQNRLEDICTLVGKDATAPSGVPLKGNLALCALLSRRMSGDALPVRARFCTLGGYVIGRLTGEHVCHMTNAAPTGLVDVQNKRWNQPLLLRAGLDGWQYPRLIHDLSPVGEWRDALVYADLGDQQVCAAGAGLKPEQTLHISLGTAGLIGMLTPQWEGGPYENRPYVLPGVYLRTVSGLPGGRHMEGLATLLQEATRSLTGCHVSRQAVWDLLTQHTQPGAAGNLWDILSQPASSMLGAYYAAFAKAYVEGVQKLCFSPREIAFSGGAASQNPSLRKALSAALGCTVVPGDHSIWQGMAVIAHWIMKQSCA